ncbi:MAG: peptide ABC transporter substrate-binding protein [Trueperaceae bacterium]|nr:MAG: peptide ABC transporter substrate-binding protein [Trueperaceae bacterium]
MKTKTYGWLGRVLALTTAFALLLGFGLAQNTTILGVELPADAVPYDEQVLRVPCDNTRNENTFDFPVGVYTRFDCIEELFQDTLVDLDKDFNVIPASAESWSVAEDGRTWTFKLHEGLVWSDGTPLTAYDYEATFQLTASPEMAWDFAWFYSFIGEGGIENWGEIIAGELPVEELGVRAIDDLTLEVVTKGVFPPLPGVMNFAHVMQKKALEEHGPFYNNDPATSVSSGPYVLVEFDPGNRIVVEANPMYRGYRPPNLKRIEGIYMSPATYFAAFQNGEIDRVPYERLTPADFAIIESDPVLSANYLRHFGDFRTDYLLFDTFNPPFDDLNVRKAFAMAVDRESIVANVFGGEIKAMPAHSMLMPGYPSSDTEGALAGFQRFDCDAARQHLADAGYPGGDGFPAQEMWLRAEAPAMAAVYQASAASIAQCLDIDIQVSNKDNKVYMDALNAKPTQLELGAVSYGMDFLDPANLLGIWVSTGRHSWQNDEFDRIVAEASNLVGNPVLRDQMFRDAERILVDDVGGVFIAHRWQGDLWQPYVLGDTLREPDATGISGKHWSVDELWSDLYIRADQ